MSKTHEQVVQELDSKIPREEVSSRDAGQGRSLDYVSGFYVISHLNRILGQSNWAYTSDIQKLHEGTIEDRYGKPVHVVHYSAKVRLVVKFPNGETTEFGDYGYGDGSDKNNPGKAHELAIKEAVTDGLKRCAKNLGNRLGLALYEKEQSNVEETPAPQPQTMRQVTVTSGSSRETVDKDITATARVCIAKGRLTKESFQALRKEKYGVDSTNALSDTQAKELLIQLKEMANG